MEEYLCHYGILGMKWGVRRYQNKDGTLTAEGKLKLKKYTSKAVKDFNKVREQYLLESKKDAYEDSSDVDWYDFIFSCAYDNGIVNDEAFKSLWTEEFANLWCMKYSDYVYDFSKHNKNARKAYAFVEKYCGRLGDSDSWSVSHNTYYNYKEDIRKNITDIKLPSDSILKKERQRYDKEWEELISIKQRKAEEINA